MVRTARFGTHNESIFTLLAATARAASSRSLALIALGAGLAALALSVAHAESWIAYATCYVVWAFASWGLLFRGPRSPRGLAFAANRLLVVSATAVTVAIGVGLFFLALGPRWML